MLRYVYRLVVCLALLTACAGASAANFSFTGTFNQDDDVQLFRFAVGGPSFTTVTLQTLSYDGGVNAAGAIIPAGGFDPVISLFDAAGTLLDENDDGIGPDPFLQIALAAGNYVAALTETPNFAVGPNLSDGFQLAGTGNFTAPGGFVDVFGNQRDGHWALDILNVASAAVGIAAVPAPGTLWLMGAALLGFAAVTRPRAARIH